MKKKLKNGLVNDLCRVGKTGCVEYLINTPFYVMHCAVYYLDKLASCNMYVLCLYEILTAVVSICSQVQSNQTHTNSYTSFLFTNIYKVK